jgi:predicted transcriptional regulator
MAGMRDLKRLPMRERQIVEIVSKAREATADEVVHMLEDPVSNSAVRSMLRRLEDKGILQHRADGRKFIYSLSVLHRDRGRARFAGSPPTISTAR